MISGTIKNSVKLDMLTKKWEQKKSSGDVMSKNELNERANWTPEQRMLNNYQEELERSREGNKRTEIANKISSGQKLTPEEEKYMASYDPQGLADYKQTQSERKSYEEKLKNCKTKEEVQRLKTTTLGSHLSSLKKIVNNPNIPLSEKLKKAQQILGKTKNIQAAEEEFIEEGKYSKLPSESEQAEERAEETKAENQIANAIIEESASKDDSEDNPNANNIASEAKNELDTEHDKVKTKIDSNKDAANEIEDIYSHLKLMQQLESGGNRDIETPEEKKVGKKMDFSV